MDFSDFRLHHLEGYVCNIYIAEYKHGLLLFDGGTANDVPRIEKFCQIIGRQAGDIKLIVLSHMHPDHAGAAPKLREKYGIPLFAHYSGYRWYTGVTGLIQYILDLMLTQGYAIKREMPLQPVGSSRIYRPDYSVKDNAVLPIFEDWQAIHAPGHTLHDIVFYNTKERVLYAGDVVISFKSRPVLPTPIPFPGRLYKTYQTLEQMDINAVFTGHGNPFISGDISGIFSMLRLKIGDPMAKIPSIVNRIYIFAPSIWKRSVARIFQIKKR